MSAHQELRQAYDRAGYVNFRGTPVRAAHIEAAYHNVGIPVERGSPYTCQRTMKCAERKRGGHFRSRERCRDVCDEYGAAGMMSVAHGLAHGQVKPSQLDVSPMVERELMAIGQSEPPLMTPSQLTLAGKVHGQHVRGRALSPVAVKKEGYEVAYGVAAPPALLVARSPRRRAASPVARRRRAPKVKRE